MTHYYALEQRFSNLSVHQNHLEGLLQHRLPGSFCRLSDSGGLCKVQVMLTRLVWGPLPKNHSLRAIKVGESESEGDMYQLEALLKDCVLLCIRCVPQTPYTMKQRGTPRSNPLADKYGKKNVSPVSPRLLAFWTCTISVALSSTCL